MSLKYMEKTYNLGLWGRRCLQCFLARGSRGCSAQGPRLVVAGLDRAVGPSMVGGAASEAESLCLGLGPFCGPCGGACAGGLVHRCRAGPIGVGRGALGEGNDGGNGLDCGFGCGQEDGTLRRTLDISLFHILKRRLPVRPISNGSEKRSELGFVYQANQ